jgi:hypothetical protein
MMRWIAAQLKRGPLKKNDVATGCLETTGKLI